MCNVLLLGLKKTILLWLKEANPVQFMSDEIMIATSPSNNVYLVLVFACGCLFLLRVAVECTMSEGVVTAA